MKLGQNFKIPYLSYRSWSYWFKITLLIKAPHYVVSVRIPAQDRGAFFSYIMNEIFRNNCPKIRKTITYKICQILILIFFARPTPRPHPSIPKRILHWPPSVYVSVISFVLLHIYYARACLEWNLIHKGEITEFYI